MNRTAAMLLALTVVTLPLAASAASSSMVAQHGAAGQAAEGQVHHAHGVVDKVNAETGRITITHDPIPSLSMDKMKMDFEVKDKSQLQGIKAGSSVDFDIVKEGPRYRITQIAPAKK
jgi:Cu/Ag efflux protein CusF